VREAQNKDTHKEENKCQQRDLSLKHEVRIRDEFAEIEHGYGFSTFILAIDERGMALFPKRMKRSLP